MAAGDGAVHVFSSEVGLPMALSYVTVVFESVTVCRAVTVYGDRDCPKRRALSLSSSSSQAAAASTSDEFNKTLPH